MEAIWAAKLVQVKYKDMQTPVLTIRDALKHPDRITDHVDFGPVDLLDVGNLEGTFFIKNKIIYNSTDYRLKLSTEGWASSETIVEGEFEVSAQYHFYMETLTATCAPTEDGMDIYCTTQDQDVVQDIVASCLNLKKSQ